MESTARGIGKAHKGVRQIERERMENEKASRNIVTPTVLDRQEPYKFRIANYNLLERIVAAEIYTKITENERD